MTDQLAVLLAALALFVGSHFALSHPLRDRLTAVVGKQGFPLAYSAVAALSFAGVVLAFGNANAATIPLWDGSSDLAWILASALTLVSSVLLIGSFSRNPALPSERARRSARKRPKGVFQVTRHPMMWAIAIWAIAHILISPTPRVIALALAMILLSLGGSALQDRKKVDQLGEPWEGWVNRTTFAPRLLNLPLVGPGPLAGGLALWLALTLAHMPAAGIQAGIWRWLAH